MSFLPSFTVSQPIGENNIVTVTDTSTGTNSAINARRVYLRKSDGTFLVPEGTATDYVDWAWVDTSIDIDVLDKDYALEITVEWLEDPLFFLSETGDSLISEGGLYFTTE